MPFIQIDGRLSWVADATQPARSQRQLIELAAKKLADMETDLAYICIPVEQPAGAAAEQPADVVCFRLEGNSWVFDKIG
jgi:hypothetical protein